MVNQAKFARVSGSNRGLDVARLVTFSEATAVDENDRRERPTTIGDIRIEREAHVADLGEFDVLF